MKLFNKIIFTGVISSFLILLSGCSPEIGSQAWCDDMKGKAKADMSMNEATDYAKNCLLK